MPLLKQLCGQVLGVLVGSDPLARAEYSSLIAPRDTGARTLGLFVPQPLLVAADELIE